MIPLPTALALLLLGSSGVDPAEEPEPTPVPVLEADLPADWLAPHLPSSRLPQGYGSSLPPGYVYARVSSRHLFILVGVRELENGDWGSLDQQFMMALTADQRIDPARVSLDLGFYASGENSNVQGISAKNYVFEVDLGLFKMLEPDFPLRPYFGAGAAFVWVSARTTGTTLVDARDFTLGAYGRVGLAYRFSYGGLIGLDFHYLGGTSVSIESLDTDVDGWTAAISFGYGF